MRRYPLSIRLLRHNLAVGAIDDHPARAAHLRDDARVTPELAQRVELLTGQCERRLGKKRLAQWPRQMVPVLTTRFATAHGELAFFSMFSTFGTPQDITLALLRVEQAGYHLAGRGNPAAPNPALAPVDLNFILAGMLQYKGLAKLANQVTQGMRGMHYGD